MPIQGTDTAGRVDGLYTFLLISSLISFIILIGGMTVFVIKYKRKTDTDKTAYITHNTFLEFLWSFIPFVIMMVIFFWGKSIYEDLRTMPEDGEEIHVVASQWAWQFKYRNGIKQFSKQGVNKENLTGDIEKQIMAVPLNKPVKLIITSTDVIHSFFVPGFRNKQDAVPGRYTTLWFQATQLGDFQVFCTEYCGLDHSNMPATIRVMTPENYQKWLADNKPSESEGAGMSAMAQNGMEIYESKCRSCHSIDGSRVVGPTWKGLFGNQREFEAGAAVPADENYIRESILNPNAKIVKGYPAAMPPYQGQLSDEEIDNIIEYMKTLK
ncbi:MAG: cytochrome c oxidase subunit II [Leptospiraceae bacterium]|nr:cytochrome c oxidase subunit II [Leptospiraceae bacterium]MCP5513287.1 cytochrome c oxidase subunit II [Leptospiraceae bacterium]